MDNPFDGFTSREMKEEIVRRENNAKKCWKDFCKAHRNLIGDNLFFAIPIAMCTAFSGMFLFSTLMMFLVYSANPWTSTFACVAVLFLLGMSATFWSVNQEKQRRLAFWRTHSKEAQELGMGYK